MKTQITEKTRFEMVTSNNVVTKILKEAIKELVSENGRYDNEDLTSYLQAEYAIANNFRMTAIEKVLRPYLIFAYPKFEGRAFIFANKYELQWAMELFCIDFEAYQTMGKKFSEANLYTPDAE